MIIALFIISWLVVGWISANIYILIEDDDNSIFAFLIFYGYFSSIIVILAVFFRILDNVPESFIKFLKIKNYFKK